MPQAVYMPMLNNNDSTAAIVSIAVKKGDKILLGDRLFEVETSKAVEDILAPKAGYVLGVCCELRQDIKIGQALVWIGDSMDEKIPELELNKEPGHQLKQGTLKQRLNQLRSLKKTDASYSTDHLRGERQSLTHFEKALRDSVMWQKNHASNAYLEIVFNRSSWQEKSQAVQKEHNLLLNPLFGLMGYRLVQLAKRYPEINSVLLGDTKIIYSTVNLGFTIQVKDALFLVVVRDAQKLSEKEFLDALMMLQRHAYAGKLTKEEVSGATISFTSLAKWGVSRHIPVLAPETSMMVAYSAPDMDLVGGDNKMLSVLGATYDHRLLTGDKVASVLNALVNCQKVL